MKRLLSMILVTLLAITTQAQWRPNPNDVPAYNAAPPAKGQKLRPVLAGADLMGPNFQHPAQAASYRAAAKIPKVLHQLPCYCYCDRGHGHNSLHSCFEDTHGAHCTTCMQEAILAEQMVREKKTVKQIRAAIMKGDFQKIDLNKVK
jgi:hypothetical protein